MAFNKVILVGNLTADPELRQTNGGISVCSFTIAVNRPKSKEGDQKCDFITCQAWRERAEFVANYFGKGKPILVCGSLQTRTWTDNQGNKRYATEVVAEEVTFVGSNDRNEQALNQPASYAPSAYTQPNFTAPASQQFEEIPDDGNLPF